MNVVLLSLISTIVFGIIDAIFFLFFEETLQTKIKKFIHVSLDMAELIVGSLSAATAIFISSNIKMSMKEELYLIDHPLLDASGILLGTFTVITMYLFYLKFIRCRLFKKFC
jgi:hypothetical protein